MADIFPPIAAIRAAHQSVRRDTDARNPEKIRRAELALKLEPLAQERAKVNQSLGGAKSSGGGEVVRQKSDNPLDTKKELAKAAHVSHDTIAEAAGGESSVLLNSVKREAEAMECKPLLSPTGPERPESAAARPSTSED